MDATRAQQQQQQVSALSTAYLAYKGCAESPASVNSKVQLSSLTESLQKQGIHGGNALQLLNSLKAQIGWQTMSPDEFRRFYQFVFFLCREEGKRNVQKDVAIAAWRGLLEGRFRLLERWCAFMSSREHYKLGVVTEDTWVQLLEFSRTVHEDLSNYDATAAWPVALDDFVEHMRRCAKKPAEPMDLSHPWPPEQVLAAVSPRSGSKRRMPLFEADQAAAEVAEKLQQLPLACTTTHTHYHLQQQQAPDAASSGSGGGHQQHHQHVVKRYRAATPPAAAPQQPLAAGTTTAAGGGALGFRIQHAAAAWPSAQQQQQQPLQDTAMQISDSPAAAGLTCNTSHSQHRMMMGAGGAAGGLHPMVKSVATTVGTTGSNSQQQFLHHQQQQQQQFAQAFGQQQQDIGNGSVAAPYDCGAAAATAAFGTRAAGGASCWGGEQEQHQHQQAHAVGCGYVRGPADAFRCNNSVNAMMQATIADSLFYA